MLLNATIILGIPSKIIGAVLGFVEAVVFSFIVLFVLMVGFLNMIPFLTSLFLGMNLKVSDAFVFTLFPIAIGYYVAGNHTKLRI